jgi:hypothetical protein
MPEFRENRPSKVRSVELHLCMCRETVYVSTGCVLSGGVQQLEPYWMVQQVAHSVFSTGCVLSGGVKQLEPYWVVQQVAHIVTSGH